MNFLEIFIKQAAFKVRSFHFVFIRGFCRKRNCLVAKERGTERSHIPREGETDRNNNQALLHSERISHPLSQNQQGREINIINKYTIYYLEKKWLHWLSYCSRNVTYLRLISKLFQIERLGSNVPN